MVVHLHEVVVVVEEGVIVPDCTVATDLFDAAASRLGVGAQHPRDQSLEGGEIADSCPAHGAHDGFVQV